MTRVTMKTFNRRCRDGEWDVQYEPNRFGLAQVRSCRTDKVITVRVTDVRCPAY